ncbi:2Fe-2S iron-sulfur cluster-binding protein [Pseudomonas aeruginosa]|uniref:FAD-dependent oxidoreductase n=1 Tax=Pseudomonas aeruginosa TaxID=287 RepID=UPI0030157D47
MSQINRLTSGGRIDRNRPLTFSFNGQHYQGYAGDTLAAALLANGVDIVGRSFKYSRARGIVAAGAEEPNAILQIGSREATQIPNVRATQQALYGGLVATSTNGWPNVQNDLMGIFGKVGGKLMPPGFYYKTFMYPQSMWMTYEKYIRKAAGLGRAPTEVDPDSYDWMNHHCDVLVVGGGPAGLAAATVAAERGHRVSLFDAAGEIGGQFNVAKRVPGKEEFHETLRYFRNKLESTGVELHLNRRVGVDDLVAGGYDEIVLATGIVPRTPAIPGIEHPKVISYLDAILERKPVGGKVAVIGAGGIGFDVSEFITHAGPSTSLEREAFWKEWGIDTRLEARGGIAGIKAEVHPAARQVFLLQRKKSKVGDGLGKTTGWIHRAGLKNKQVQMVNAVEYLGIDDAGLHIRVAEGEPQVLPVDTVIVCAGQDPLRELQDGLLAAGQSVHLIGGADVAAELDAKRAINQGSRLAAEL